MTQTIFITGCSTGLGRATALLFAAKGWKVIATMREPEKEETLHKVEGVTVMRLDVTEPSQIARASEAALSMGPVDVLFNNAGYGLAGAFEAATDDQMTRLIATDLLGVMRVTRAFLPSMRDRGSGVIVSTTSIGGLTTYPFNAIYHAAKWGLEGWSESLAFELALFGIRVKTVAPGGMATDFATRSIVLTPHPKYMDAITRTTMAFMDPARRKDYSTAEQVAEVVYEAALDESDHVTFVAGKDAKESYAQRLTLGIDGYRAVIRRDFLG
jgi:NAD(P)-dependent dehydrogenase (short-subunit alcohol dehydrogenase family)